MEHTMYSTALYCIASNWLRSQCFSLYDSYLLGECAVDEFIPMADSYPVVFVELVIISVVFVSIVSRTWDQQKETNL